jgi:hypothetical protein
LTTQRHRGYAALEERHEQVKAKQDTKQNKAREVSFGKKSVDRTRSEIQSRRRKKETQRAKEMSSKKRKTG